MPAFDFELEIRTEDTRLISLAQQYWEQDVEGKFPEKVADLALAYGLKASDVAKTVAGVAVARSTTKFCARCEAGCVFSSRADYPQQRSWSRWDRQWTCETCRSEMAAQQRAEEREQQTNQRGALYSHFSLDGGGVLDVGALSLEEAITLLAVIRVGADEKLETIQPIGDRLLSPFRELDREILDHLAGRRLLQIDPESNTAAFEWEELDPARYFPFNVVWQVSDGERRVAVDEAQAALESALRARVQWAEAWRTEVGELWSKLALNECLEYLRISLDDHGLGKKMGEKTRHVIENALTDFSIGQVYNFIWRAAKDAAAYYLREPVSKTQAANTVVGAIERSAERALANGWEVKDYRRDRRATESPVVHLFTAFAGLGEHFWTQTPDAEAAGRGLPSVS